MSNKKSIKKKERVLKSAQELIGIKEINDQGVSIGNNQMLVFFKIRPINVAVLPQSTIEAKIYSLTNVLKNISEFEIICLNSAESFEGNKTYMKDRLEQEDNPIIHQLLMRDMKFLDEKQVESATAREFLFLLRARADRYEQLVSDRNRVEKILKEQGFEAQRANKKQIKRILAVYFAQNVVTDYFDDFDGIRYVNDSLMDL